ncbi:MAG: hypothetical protein LAN83_01490 [Acidobacteriia bacterium]|nr:hypothetical protein [Terriglobia bacterium]
MAKVLKYSVIATVVLCMVVLGAALTSGAAMAQDDASSQGTRPGQQAENPGARADSAQAFDHWLRKNPEARQEIMKDPSLLNNPDYMAKHPDLQKFMSEHPDFQKAAQKNPNRVMHRSEHQEHNAAARHKQRENNGRPAKQ